MTMMIIIIIEQLQILETASVNGIIDPCQALPWSQLTYFTLGKNPRCTLTEVKKVKGSECGRHSHFNLWQGLVMRLYRQPQHIGPSLSGSS